MAGNIQHRAARQLIAASILLLSVLAPEINRAQDASEDGSTVVYPATYFTEWQPITAGDMLARIPGQDTNGRGSGGGGFSGPGGFSGSPSRGGRGLGSGAGSTEILINGKRNAGKNNSTQQMLQRIASSQVQEIQIIRGTSGDLDVRGSGQIINVVLFEELSSTSFSYQGSLNYSQDDAIQPGGTFAVNGQHGELDYTMTLRSQPRYRNSLNNESSILGDFSPNDTVTEEVTIDGANNELSFNLAYAINSKSTLQLNGLLAERDAPTDIERVTSNLRSNPVAHLVEREANPNPRDNWEGGFDYEYTFDNGARFKLLGIANQDENLRIRQRFERFANNTEELNLILNSNSITKERIVRGSYTFDFLQNQSVEIGGERAQTTLNSALALGLLNASGTPSTALGGLVPVNLGLANSQVEEIRYEPFAIHNWPFPAP